MATYKHIQVYEDGSNDNDYVMYIDTDRMTGRMIEEFDDSVDSWILANELEVNVDYKFTGTCSCVLGADRKLIRICPHGIRFFRPELETAFRLKFLCK